MLRNILGKIAYLFSRKKSSPSTLIKFYIEKDDIKIEFSVGNINDFNILSTAVLNGRLRDATISVIATTLAEHGLLDELDSFSKSVSSSILPSEFII
jgi:hypothetical protein